MCGVHIHTVLRVEGGEGDKGNPHPHTHTHPLATTRMQESKAIPQKHRNDLYSLLLRM